MDWTARFHEQSRDFPTSDDDASDNAADTHGQSESHQGGSASARSGTQTHAAAVVRSPYFGHHKHGTAGSSSSADRAMTMEDEHAAEPMDEGDAAELGLHQQDEDEDEEELWEQVGPAQEADDHPHSEQAEQDAEEAEDADEAEDAGDEGTLPSDRITSNIELSLFVENPANAKRRLTEREQLQKQLAQQERATAKILHRVHLACLLANAFWRNLLSNDETIRAAVLSVVPASLLAQRRDTDFLKDAALWYRGAFRVVQRQPPPHRAQLPLPAPATMDETRLILQKTLLQTIAQRQGLRGALSIVFTALLRALDLDARLVVSLQPMSWKLPVATVRDRVLATLEELDSIRTAGETRPNAKSTATARSSEAEAPLVHTLTPSFSSLAETHPPLLHSTTTASMEKANATVVDSDDDIQIIASVPAPARVKTVSVATNSLLAGQITPPTSFSASESSVKSSGGFILAPPLESERSVVVDQGRTDSWSEVFLPDLDCWVPIDTGPSGFNNPLEFERHATAPLQYVLAFEENGRAKDVTARYASQWLRKTGPSRQRLDAGTWFADLLRSPLLNRSVDAMRDQREDAQLSTSDHAKSLPTTLQDYKNHPLYALERHLLKYQAIHPLGKQHAVGLYQGQNVYPRSHVHTLRTREAWLKDARVVRDSEHPVKVVKAKANPNSSRAGSSSSSSSSSTLLSGKRARDSDDENDTPSAGAADADERAAVPLFGEWQTVPYDPPVAVGGRVPCNSFGNVDLYQPSMIPRGCVHLELPNAPRLARQLGIDFAPAVVGFNFHGGKATPDLRGIVVCTEFARTLVDACVADEDRRAQDELTKRRASVYGMWLRLTRGLLVRATLHEKFLPEDPAAASSSKQKPADILRVAIPDSVPLLERVAKALQQLQVRQVKEAHEAKLATTPAAFSKKIAPYKKSRSEQAAGSTDEDFEQASAPLRISQRRKAVSSSESESDSEDSFQRQSARRSKHSRR
ncbi:xeroderma pigmentosum group C complementing factor [Capsaspora owczarzaki ATCC 30864]|uniref:xeroderma pigmentosum group C complementing factor n=1 Tax=Capsaspora owczarzaki (strain ATCC 30864) TaxID=595528 RepID=UPI0001FE262A|nr:xeroderma pigmentosum group C complementing factor [Capsaspora owczarzaki ATCC 30864]|eukprot:XP_004364112.1 xeroderma pigmentosum group C complementing factor [Capsaspora owczarzaki ATCC 30864]